jgi:anti-sigma factor RsiW
MTERPGDGKLAAYLDGELNSAERADLETRLEREPALRDRLAEIGEATSLVKEAFDPVLREPVPRRLLHAATADRGARILRFPARVPLIGGTVVRIRRGWASYAAAASILGIICGGSAMYLAASGQQGASVLDNIASTHNFVIASANAGENAVFDVPPGAETRLPNDIRIPDMNPWGLDFQGARHLVLDGGKPAYQFFFKTDGKPPGPTTVTVWQSDKPDMLPTFERHENENVMYWRHGGRGVAIVSEANKGYLWNMAQDIAWQLRNP